MANCRDCSRELEGRRQVCDDCKAQRSKPKLAPLVAKGNRRSSLEALRNALAVELDNCTASTAYAPLSKRLSEVMAELDGIPNPKEREKVDDLAARRERRRSGAANKASS